MPLKAIGQAMLGTDHPSAKPWCDPPQWTPETSVEDDLDTRPLTRAMFEAAVAAVIDLPTLFTRMKEEASLKLYEAILTQTQRWMVNVAQRPKFVQVSTIVPSSSSSSSSSLSSSVRGQRENESCVTTHGTRVSLVNTSTSKSIEVVRLDIVKDPVLGFRLHHPKGRYSDGQCEDALECCDWNLRRRQPDGSLCPRYQSARPLRRRDGV